ncbi:hypothetical protein LEP1GSC120_2702 [Leptospira santarosai str. 200702252]|nr:hypothetical protein LEP1GSC130_1477 [Leptospira santarosai str. 200403458]EMP00056.1 hypothetical protein LEP1GSC120_2702 [Leptospira santarosai str. 200702252]
MVFRRLDGNTFKNRAKKYGWRKVSVEVKYRHIRILPPIGKKEKISGMKPYCHSCARKRDSKKPQKD